MGCLSNRTITPRRFPHEDFCLFLLGSCCHLPGENIPVLAWEVESLLAGNGEIHETPRLVAWAIAYFGGNVHMGCVKRTCWEHVENAFPFDVKRLNINLTTHTDTQTHRRAFWAATARLGSLCSEPRFYKEFLRFPPYVWGFSLVH